MTGMIEKTYAQAVFELGLEDDTLDTLYREITEVSHIFDANPELMKLLSAPTISTEEKLSVLGRLFKGKISEEAYHFLCVLTEKNRAKFLGKIAAELKQKYNDHYGIVEITATTSIPLSEALRTKLISKLESVSGKKINLVERLDKSILGGIVLNYGNTQMDASVKARLDALRLQMKNLIA